MVLIESKTSLTDTNTSALYSSSSQIQNWFLRRLSRLFNRFLWISCPNISGSDFPHITTPETRSFHARWCRNESTDTKVLHCFRSFLMSSILRFLRKSETNRLSPSTQICTTSSLTKVRSSCQNSTGGFLGFSDQLRSFWAKGWIRIIGTFYDMRPQSSVSNFYRP